MIVKKLVLKDGFTSRDRSFEEFPTKDFWVFFLSENRFFLFNELFKRDLQVCALETINAVLKE